jgi:hypothetical protein
MAKICHFVKKKTSPKPHGQRNFLEIFQKNCHIARKKVMKIAKIFVGFGQISSFLPLPYVANRFE